MMPGSSRRQVLTGLGYAALGGYVATSRGYAANETISVGCIGTGGRAQALMRSLAKIPGARTGSIEVRPIWEL